MTLKIDLKNKNIKIPTRAHASDTGLDIYMPHSGMISPDETVVLPLGFSLVIPNGYSARLQTRTSIASKGIICSACAIDAGYTGEWHLILHNISDSDFFWSIDDRIAYIEIFPVVYANLTTEITERKDDNFGSTGR